MPKYRKKTIRVKSSGLKKKCFKEKNGLTISNSAFRLSKMRTLV